MKHRMHKIFAQGIVLNQRKKIYDAVYKIGTMKTMRANERLHEYKWRLDHVQIDLSWCQCILEWFKI